MAPAWCVQFDSWKGCAYASWETTLSTGQVVTLATLEANSPRVRVTKKTAQRCARCIALAISSDASNQGGKPRRHQLFWRTFFLDHTRWWDNRRQKRNSRSHDFRYKDSGKDLWHNCCCKPAWVDAQLAVLDARAHPAELASPGSLSPDYAHQLVGPSRYENRLSPEFVKKLCKQGQVKEAVEVLEILVKNSPGIDKYLLYYVLKECVARKNLMLGGHVHALVVKMGFASDTFLCNHLIRMYAAHGKLREAMDLFTGVAHPDAFMWSSIISACAKQGQPEQATNLYQQMRATNIKPDKYVYAAALQACAAAGDLRFGKQLHAEIEERSFEPDVVVGASLVNMYAKCGSLTDARIVFDGLREKNVVTWTAMIAGYAQQEGMGQDALSLYSAMHNEGRFIPTVVTFVCLLQACANVGVSALEKGRQLHSQVKEGGLECNVALGGSLVNMYAKCGSLTDARIVFDGLREKNVLTWNAMIAGYAQQDGMGQEALNIYSAMRNNGMAAPDGVAFVSLLQACANMGVSALEKGKLLHSDMKERGLESDVAVGGSLVNMYAKCGSLTDARIVFDGLREKNVVTWSAMIAGYAQQEGMGLEALNIYSAMRGEEVAVPDRVTFLCLLQACANVGVSALEKGKQLHSQMIESGLESDVALGGSLVNMYAKCGSLPDARVVFDGLREKNVVTWTAMIAGFAQQEGMGQDALSLHNAMRNEGMTVPDQVTYVCLLQACANMGVSALEKGKQLHSEIKEHGLESDLTVGGSLVNMYAKCGSPTDARTVFDGLREKDVVTWTAMISGYAQQEGMGQDALNIFSAMRNEGMGVPNAVTYGCLLQACANVGVSALEKGKQLHSQIKEESGLETDVALGGILVNMYAKCGSLTDARIVFDGLREKNVVSWTAMITGYAQQEGMGQDALDLYSAMRKEGTAVPDRVTCVCLLQACATMGVSALGKGKQLHSEIKERGLGSDIAVGGSVVNMYAKCGSLTDARIVFDGLREKDVVTWTAMISGYAQQEGMGQEALNIFSAMRNEGKAVPNAVTYVSLLQACASVGALQQGKGLHSEIREAGLESEAPIGTCLIDMYAQCGRLEISRQVFDRLPVKSVESWNTMIKGYGEHGEGRMAIQCFEELLDQGIQPDDVTYICLLTACSRAGLVSEGERYFDTMEERHGVKPDERHYSCMVDLLGRSGHLDRAEEMLLGAAYLAGSVVSWTALLSACKNYGDAHLGKRCFDRLVTLEPASASPYVLLEGIYANAGRWDEVEKVEILRKAAGARKKAAVACIEVKEEVHKFTVGEERCDVGATLRKMNTRVKEGGHVPQTQLVLRANVSEHEKEDALCGHAEKLALAYGLLNTPAGSSLVVTKNLRMCNDCHSSTKIMSRVEKREIVVRDASKVHRFQNGACSCQDRP